MTAVVGVDVGSQRVKGVLLDPAGTVRAQAAASLNTAYPRPACAEQDPREWEAALASVVGRLLEVAELRGTAVSVLNLACQVDGLVPVGAGGLPLAPAIIWLDRRAAAEAAWLRDTVGAERLLELTGLAPDASHTGPKIRWLRDHQPEVFAAAVAFPCVAGYLVNRLTGRLAIDYANASSSLLYDLNGRRWADELLEAVGITADQLGALHESTTVIGTLTDAAAEHLGLSPACRVLVGTGDDHAAAVGTGVIAPGPVADVTGTAEPVATCSLSPVRDPRALVEAHAHAVEGQFLIENPGFVSGGSVRWLADSVLNISQADVLELAGSAAPGAGGVRFLPALSGSMTPRWNSRMRGAFAGVNMRTGRGELARAVVGGCCFALRDVIDRFTELGLDTSEIRVVGGGARSAAWLQAKADVTGRPICAADITEASALGAALIGAVVAGSYADLAEAVKEAVPLAAEPILPRAEHASLYADAYAEYRALFDGVEGALA